MYFTLSTKDFQYLTQNGQVVDATRGGLVIGRSHDEGHIHMFVETENGYENKFNMQGGEYIINHDAYLKHKDRIEFINSHKHAEQYIPVSILCKTPLLITQGIEYDKYLMIDPRGQFVINNAATALFLEELNKINADGLK